MSKSKPSKHRRQLQRARRRELARALRARLYLHGEVYKIDLEVANTNDLGILHRLVKAWGA